MLRLRLKCLFVMSSVALLAVGLTVGSPVFAGHPMTFEDMVRIQTPSGLAVSPTGKQVAYVVSGRELESNSGWSRVYVMGIDGDNAFPVTVGGEHEGSPAWSTDGKQLVITSDQGGKNQLWRIDAVTRAKGIPVTQLATGAGSPRWAKDGSGLFFTSQVYPACKDAACNKQKLEAVAANPVKAQVFTRLMYRHWDHWRDGRVSHIHWIALDGKEAVDLMAGDSWGVTGAWDVSADGKTAVYTTKNPLDETLSTNNDIYAFDIELAKEGKFTARQVTDNLAFDNQPVLSPDGKLVMYHSHERALFESDMLKVTIAPLAGGEPVKLAGKLDRPAHEFGWFPKGKKVWFAVSDQGRVSVYTAKVNGKGKPEKVLGGAVFTDISLTPNGRYFIAVRHSLTSAPEIWKYKIGRKGEQLSHFNDKLMADIDLATVEEVWWEGGNGDQVHGFLLFPPGTSKDQKNPFLLLIHGGPQGAWMDRLHPRWNAQLFAAPGYVTLLANPRGSTGYGQVFTDQISRDWGGLCFNDLMMGVDHLVKEGIVDESRMCAGGGSFGGYMANWILGTTNRFKCLISHAGVYDLTSKYGSTDELWFPEWEFGGPPWDSEDYEVWSPSTHAENFATPMLVIHGAHDYRVALNQAMQLFTALQRQGVPSKFLYYPDETHFVVKPKNSQLWYATIHDWLKEWIGQ
jgi:dipeptidyl aminopeptidase/acylaminoacyl peptidase